MNRVVFVFVFMGCVSLANLQAATTTTSVAAKSSAAGQPAQIFSTAPAPPPVRHLFPVNDAKGLLLTCIAPEIDTNPETDQFRDCTLAPGRTLDDVMHTFIGAIHYVQNEAMRERTGQTQSPSPDKPSQK